MKHVLGNEKYFWKEKRWKKMQHCKLKSHINLHHPGKGNGWLAFCPSQTKTSYIEFFGRRRKFIEKIREIRFIEKWQLEEQRLTCKCS